MNSKWSLKLRLLSQYSLPRLVDAMPLIVAQLIPPVLKGVLLGKKEQDMYY